MKILLVEDEKKIASFVERGLKEECYAVDAVDNGEDALHLASENTYDLIILDIMLPDIDGVTICKKLRNRAINIPVLLLTAKDKVDDKVRGFASGADDYLTKPFAFQELLARISALLRRNRESKSPLIKVADLELNQLTHKVSRSGKEINLSNKEYSLLEYFMLHANQVVTRTMISEHVWNEDFDSFTNVIDVYVNYLRKKIDKGSKNKLIHTLRGTGYILKESSL